MHQVGRFQLGPTARQRMLDRLVPADLAVEHHALFGIACGFLERDPAQAHQAGGDQDALGVDAVQQVAKAAAFLTNTILDRYHQAVDEHRVGVEALAAHFVDLVYLHLGTIEVGIEK